MRYLFLFISICITLGLHAQSAQPVYKDSAFVNALLRQHNNYRAAQQLPYLTWSGELAADAKAWAVHLAAIDKGDHDQSIRGREGKTSGGALPEPSPTATWSASGAPKKRTLSMMYFLIAGKERPS